MDYKLSDALTAAAKVAARLMRAYAVAKEAENRENGIS